MAMMISKFHRLIQSRILWGVFLVIIVFSFVIWGMVWPSQVNELDRANAAGTLDGEPVTPGEFRSAYLSSYLGRALTLGREAESTPASDEQLRRMSWQRLATLREASALGITASDEELVNALRSNFAETNGAYNPQRYQAFLQNVIRPMGFSAAQFEQHVREEIAIQKLGNLIGRQAQVTPLEIRRTFETLMDEFTVTYATVAAASVEKSLTVGEDEARRLYDEDPAAFTVPEQREIAYAAFPVAEYLDEQAEFSEDEILDYYELHIEDYTTEETDTNGMPRQVVAELDEVKDGIVTALRRDAALAKADAAAAELSFRAIPDRDGTIPDFAAEAEKAGRTTVKLPPFSRFDLPVEDAGAALAAAAFELEPGAFDRISAPVAGKDNVYVLCLEKIHPPRVPEFAEAKEQALAAARRKALAEALAAKGEEVKQAAVAGLAAGKTFAEAVAGLDVPVATAPSFTGLTGSSSTNAAVQVLVQAVVGFNQGEVADPVALDDDLIVPYLVARTPGDPAAFDSYQNDISTAIRNRRAQGLFRDWQAALLAPERFTDLQRTAPAAEDEETDTDAPPAEDAETAETM